jgi:uridine kinase
VTVLARLAALVAATAPGRTALVAVDGVDGSGKTTLADGLAAAVTSRTVSRLSVDDFLRPEEERYRRGRDSPEGCYRDSHDLAALRRTLRRRAGDAVVVVDGVFLLRPELDVEWDLTVHLQVPDEEVLRRALVRDGPDAAPRYRSRYLPAQRLYEAECRPADRADVLLDNTDPQAPVVLRWP